MSDIEKNELGQMSFLDRLFVNKKAFTISNVVAIICFLYMVCIELFFSDMISIFRLVSSVTLIISLISLEYCSRNYRDSAVKNIIGVILGIVFTYDLRFFDRDYSFYSTTNIIIGVIKIALGLALVVLYISARDSKKSNYRLISYVRIAFFVLAVFTILDGIPYFSRDLSGDTMLLFILDIAETLAFICTYFSVVCATSSVDRYKLIREYYTELGNWTEERREETKKELFG